MDATAVDQAVAPLKSKLRALGVEQLLLVGSVARGDQTKDSDVDFVVDFKGPARFLDYMELVELLENAVGGTVDVTTMRALRPEIAAQVLAEARQVA